MFLCAQKVLINNSEQRKTFSACVKVHLFCEKGSFKWNKCVE